MYGRSGEETYSRHEGWLCRMMLSCELLKVSLTDNVHSFTVVMRQVDEQPRMLAGQRFQCRRARLSRMTVCLFLISYFAPFSTTGTVIFSVYVCVDSLTSAD